MNADEIFAEAQKYFTYTQALRRDFHQYPELGFQEVRTAGVVARELNQLNLEIATGVAETGVVALLEGKKPGPVLLLRFDMDALPIQEETGAAYASQNPHVMHACGHDGHTAVGLTVAKMLHGLRDQFGGTVKLVFQPAEEGLGGAKKMVEAGVLDNPRPDYTLALHVWNDKPVGWLGVTEGPAMAAAEVFKIRLTGSGGHGASPHLAIDPVVAAAQVITALQTIVARNTNPLDTAVVSVTTLHGGDAFNIIPSSVEMQGTIRTYQAATRSIVMQRFEEIVTGMAAAMNCEAEINLRGITPAVINHPAVTQRVYQVARQMFPEADISTTERTMGSEDASLFMQDIPGCYFFIGSANSTAGLNAPHHHPRFDFDEAALPRAAGLMTAAALEFLAK